MKFLNSLHISVLCCFLLLLNCSSNNVPTIDDNLSTSNSSPSKGLGLYWVAYECGDNICLISEDGEIKQITDDELSSDPVWSPDATSVYFALHDEDPKIVKFSDKDRTLTGSDIYKRHLNSTDSEFYYGASLMDSVQHTHAEIGIESPYQFSATGDFLVIKTHEYSPLLTTCSSGNCVYEGSLAESYKIIDSQLNTEEYLMNCSVPQTEENYGAVDNCNEFEIQNYNNCGDTLSNYIGFSPDEEKMVGSAEYLKWTTGLSVLSGVNTPAVTSCSLNGTDATRLTDLGVNDPSVYDNTVIIMSYNKGVAIDNEGDLYHFNDPTLEAINNILGDLYLSDEVMFLLAPNRERVAFIFLGQLYVLNAQNGDTISAVNGVSNIYEWSIDGERLLTHSDEGTLLIVDPDNIVNNKELSLPIDTIKKPMMSPRPVSIPIIESDG